MPVVAVELERNHHFEVLELVTPAGFAPAVCLALRRRIFISALAQFAFSDVLSMVSMSVDLLFTNFLYLED